MGETLKQKIAAKPKVGRPEVAIDWGTAEELCRIHCTKTEVAAVLRIDPRTLDRRCKKDLGENFADFMRRFREEGKASLRRVQWEMALAKDRVMVKWLGQNELGQSEKQSVDQSVKAENRVVYFPDNGRG